MVIERFSQGVINSGIFRLYIATGFFATLIFFVVNADLFTPFEMVFSVIGITIILKGVSNMMLSLIIALFSFDNKREELDFKHNEEKINAMLSELSVQEAQGKLNENESEGL